MYNRSPHYKWSPQERWDVRDRVVADLHVFGRPVDDGQYVNHGPFCPGSKEAHDLNLWLVLLREYLVRSVFNVQCRVLYYHLKPLFLFFLGQQLGAQALILLGLAAGALTGPPILSTSPTVGSFRAFVGMRLAARRVLWVNRCVCTMHGSLTPGSVFLQIGVVSAPGWPGLSFLVLQV